MMLQRWSKLERDFRMKNGRYDISKIPDIYDCIKYDSQHNASLGLEDTLELFRLSRALADIVIPQVPSAANVTACVLTWCSVGFSVRAAGSNGSFLIHLEHKTTCFPF